MTDYFEITNEQLSSLKDNIIVITGCASGIGLATTQLLLSLGSKVVAGDLQPPPIQHSNLTFQTTDVTKWTDLTSLFELASSSHNGQIDHVFANAGIGSRTSYVELQKDSSGQLLEPNHQVFDVNLRAVVNTSVLAFHYMRAQQPSGGSVVVTASASSFQRFCLADYASAKHGVLGFMRGMTPVFESAGIPIRVNGIAPSWTITGMVPVGLVEAAGKATQTADAVARSVAILMADRTRSGHLIYSAEGRFREIDEAVLLKANKEIFGDDLDDNTVMERMAKIVEQKEKESQKVV